MTRLNVGNIRHPDASADSISLDSSARVGIGTSSPVALLTVGSTSTSSTNATIASSTSGNGGIYFHDGANSGAVIYNHASNYLQFRVNSAERFRIDSSGRLLVGTSSNRTGTNVQFQLEGTGYNNSSGSFIRNSADAGGPSLLLAKSRGTADGSYTAVQQNDTLGTIQFTGSDGTTDKPGAYIQAYVDGSVGSNTIPARLTFLTTSGSGGTPTERMRIDSNGRVKIGNDTNYSAASGSKLAVELMTTAGTILEIADQTSGFSTFESVKNAGGGATDYGGYIFSGRRDADDDIQEYLRITSAGNVGIGVTSPAEKLHVGGGTNDRITISGSGSSGIKFENSSGTDLFQIVYDDASTDNCFITTSDALVFRNQSGTQGGTNTERMTITSDGYVRLPSGSPGIQFDGNTAADDSLDDYEEGTWTPSFGGLTSPTYSTQKGRYTRIGNFVIAECRLKASDVGTADGSALRILGLPFDSNVNPGARQGSYSINYIANFGSGNNEGTLEASYIGANTNQFNILGNGHTSKLNTLLSDGAQIDLMVCYRA